ATTLPAAAGAAAALWFIAGIRAYFSILLWAAMAVTSAACVMAGVPSRRRALVQSAVVLAAVALVINFGAEGNYPLFVKRVAAAVSAAAIERKAPMARGGFDELDRRREAIDNYGGDSMITSPRRSGGTPTQSSGGTPTQSRGDTPTRSSGETPTQDSPPRSRLAAVAVGVAAVFIPVSVLEGLSIVDLNIGRMAR